MFRSLDGTMPGTEAEFASYNPVIPYGVVAVSIDGGTKVGDGVTQWSDIAYTSGSIGTKRTDTDDVPTQDDIPFFNSVADEWQYRLQGAMDTASNWESNTSVFPSYAILLELNNITSRPSGRFKLGDGSTQFASLPWFGSDVDLTDFPTGYGIKFNGTYMEAAHFVEVGECIVASIPTGTRFACDDGSWKAVSDVYLSGPTTSVNNGIVAFDGTTGRLVKDSGVKYTDFPTVLGTSNGYWQIGSGVKLTNLGGNLKIYNADGTSTGNITVNTLFSDYATVNNILYIGPPTEPTSVSLTSDGTYLYVDGGKVWTHVNDGTGSGLDADTVNGFHASEFATIGNVTTLDSDALVYSIVFGG